MSGWECPFCRTQVVQSSERAGRFIACPSCSNYFEAPATVAAPPVRQPVRAAPPVRQPRHPTAALPPAYSQYAQNIPPVYTPPPLPPPQLDFSQQPGSARQVHHNSVTQRYKKKISSGATFGLGGGGLLVVLVLFRVLAAVLRLMSEH